MTAPAPVGRDHDEPVEKRPRGFEADELPAVYVALGVVFVAILLAVAAYAIDDIAFWPMAVGAALVALGLWGGIRGASGCGVVLLAIGSMVMTSDWGLTAALITNALVIICCLLVLVGTDLAFVMRRGSKVAAATLQGLAGTHAVALGIGIAASALVVGIVEAIDWPSWLIVVPIAVLTIASVWLVRWVRSYRSSVTAADAPVVGRGPAATTRDTSWRQFKYQPK